MKSISFKNFRNSGTEITRINLRSVSIFTGCNSAGKSSAAKALILLNSYLQDVKNNNNNLIDTPLDFSKIVKLGSFDNVLNKQARENGAHSIMLGFSIESFFNVGEIEYQFYFVKKDGDFLENGWLKSLVVYVNNTPLFTIKIVDNNYQIKVDDSEGLVRYYRNYMITQLAVAYRYAQGCNEYIAKCSDKERKYIKDDINTEFVEAISSLDLHSVLQEEERLIAESSLEKSSNLEGLNFSLLKGIEQYEVDGLCANVLRYNLIDLLITQIETQNGRKLTLEDMDSVVTEYEKRALIKTEAIVSISKDPALVTKLRHQQIKKRKDELIKTIKEYIESDATCRMEYASKHEGNLIDEYVSEYNESAGLYVDTYKKNVLNAYSFIYGNARGISGFVDNLIEKAIDPDFCGHLKYVDASTVDVKRLYQVDDSSQFGKSWKLFNEISKRNDENNSFSPIKPGQFMQKWLKELGICNDFVVSNVEGAINIKLITDDVPEGRPLADYGYGVTQLLSLLLNIEIALNNISVRYYISDINDMLYGVEPLYGYTPFWIVIEEPEVHLHPGLQSKLADMFREASNYGARFIIETHSEYMVRRSQTLVAQMGLDDAGLEKRNPFIVYYFSGNGFPYDMKFQPNGHFEESFGTGFFDEAGKWSRELIRTKR